MFARGRDFRFRSLSWGRLRGDVEGRHSVYGVSLEPAGEVTAIQNSMVSWASKGRWVLGPGRCRSGRDRGARRIQEGLRGSGAGTRVGDDCRGSERKMLPNFWEARRICW